MCGRYYIGEKIIDQVQKAIGSIELSMTQVFCGDITPAMKAPVIAGRNNKPVLEQMTWGFHKFENQGLIINARAETVTEKRLFKECVKYRRILIPASGFYEWDKDKNKVTFTLEEQPVLFLAGFYQRTEDAPDGRFVVMTTAANKSMEAVHERMPLMIKPESIDPWLYSEDVPDGLIHADMPILTAYREYEQQSLF